MLKINDIDKNRVNSRVFLLLGLLIYTISLAIRHYYYISILDLEIYKNGGVPLLNNVDGYYYAEGAKELLTGIKTNINYHSNEHLISYLTALVTFITRAKLDSVILFLPTVFSSLLIFPMLYFGRALKNDYLGLALASVVSIMPIYYNRTLIGYFDTDMLNIVLPMTLVTLLYRYIDNINIYIKSRNNIKYLIVIAFFSILYNYWYPQSKIFIISFAIFASILILFFKRYNLNSKIYIYRVLLLLVITYLSISIYLLVPLVLLYIYIINKMDKTTVELKNGEYSRSTLDIMGFKFNGILVTILFAIIVFGLYTYLNLDFIINNFKEFVLRQNPGNVLHYLNVTTTIRETKVGSFWLVIDNIMSNRYIMILSLIGTLILFIKRPITILFIPFFALGYLSFRFGLRFMFYSLPLATIGYFYLFFTLITYIKKNNLISKIFKILIILLSISYLIFISINHILNYRPIPIMTKFEVNALKTIKSVSQNSNDVIFTWWDYGYPIRYYSGLNTLVDGEVHSGSLNFPIAFMFNSIQYMSRNMVKYTYNKLLSDGDVKNNRDYIQAISKDLSLSPKQFLLSLQDPNLEVNTIGDVYIYIPQKISFIYNVIQHFTSIDIATGKKNKIKTFIPSVKLLKYKNGNFDIIFSSKFKISYKNKMFISNNRVVPIKYFIDVSMDKYGKTKIKANILNNSANLVLVYIRSYEQIILMDASLLNSTYVRLSLLGNYDKNIYDLVYADIYSKVYKVKK